MANPVWQYNQGLNSFGGDFGATLAALSGGVTPGSGAWPAANDAIFVPFYLQQTTLVKRLFVVNGVTASGNIDVGIYTGDGARMVSAGSTAQSGTSTLQFFDVTDLVLGPDKYYFAVAMDNTTGTLLRGNISVVRAQALGMAKQASAFALPSSANLATVTSGYLPLVGAEINEIR